MKIRIWSTAALLALALASSVARAQDDSLELVSNYDISDVPTASDSIAASYADQSQAPPVPGGTAEEVTTPAPGTDGNAGDVSTCGTCCNTCKCGPYSEPCPRIGAYAFTGVDSFRGVTNSVLAGNNGALAGFNLAGALSNDYGIGWQFGSSYGVYNFSGQLGPQPGQVMQQVFITTGLFRRANVDRRLSWGLVHDWMIADNFGVLGNSMTLAQWRGQVAWAVSARNEFGVWATVQDRTVTRQTAAFGTPANYRAIDQGNLFWHHKYAAYGADSWFYVGIPLDKRLSQANTGLPPIAGTGGSLGSFILGTNWLVPISDRLSGYCNLMYMKPSASSGVSSAGAFAAAQEFWNVSVGLAWYPGRAARSQSVAGRQWMPYMPMANNSNFLVDGGPTP